MSDKAPERLFAQPVNYLKNPISKEWKGGRWSIYSGGGKVEYVRADKLEELTTENERLNLDSLKVGDQMLAEKFRADKAEAAIAEAKRENEAATVYAETLATALHAKHYAEITNWRPLSGDLFGLLTQIDNMAAGLARHAGEKNAE